MGPPSPQANWHNHQSGGSFTKQLISTLFYSSLDHIDVHVHRHYVLPLIHSLNKSLDNDSRILILKTASIWAQIAHNHFGFPHLQLV